MGRTQMRRISATAIVVALGAVLVWAVPSGASLGHGSNKPGKNLWSHVTGKVPATHDGAKLDVRPDKQRAFTLDQNGLGSLLDAGAGARSAVVSLPDPTGGFQRFALEKSDIMAPGPRREASRDRDLQRPRHRRPGGDDPRRPEPARLPRVGPLAERRLVHRPVLPPRPERLRELLRPRRAKDGARTRSSSATPTRAELSVDKGYYHAADDVTVSRQRLRRRTRRSRSRSRIRRSSSPTRTLTAHADDSGAFDDELRRRSGRQPRDAHRRGERRRRRSASASYQVVRDDDPTERPADRRRPAHLPARADHRSGLRRLLRRPGERDRGEGHADQPRRARSTRTTSRSSSS